MPNEGYSYKFPRELWGLLGQNKDFFDPVLQQTEEINRDLAPDQNLSPPDPERIETRYLDNGDVEVKLLFSVDNNSLSADGRIYLQDRFILSGHHQRFKEFERSFPYHGEGEAPEPWKQWLENYKNKNNSIQPSQDRARDFAAEFLKSTPRPLPKEWMPLWPKQQGYIFDAFAPLFRKRPQWEIIHFSDPQNSFAQIDRSKEDGEIDLVFRYAVGPQILETDTPQDSAGPKTSTHLVGLFLQDRYVMDARTGHLKDHLREWQVPPELESEKVLARLASELKGQAKPTREADLDFIHTFLPQLISSYDSRPMEQPVLDKLSSQMDYAWAFTGAAQRALNSEDWIIKPALSEIHVFPWEGGSEYVFSYALDKNDDAGDGRLWMHDHFYVDPEAEDSSPKFERRWSVDPEVEYDSKLYRYLSDKAKQLNRASNPTDEEIQNFFETMKPILPQPVAGPTAEEAMYRLAQALGPSSMEEVFPQGLPEKKTVYDSRPDVALSLQLMHAVAQDQLAERYDRSRGLLNTGSEIDATAESQKLQNLFTKAVAQLEHGPVKDAFSALRQLKFEEGEGQVAQAIFTDPLMDKLNNLSQQKNPRLKAQRLINFATQDLWQGNRYFASATFTAQAVQEMSSKFLPIETGSDAAAAEKWKGLKDRSSQFLATLEGGGSPLAWTEHMGPVLAQETVGNPAMLAGFMAFPLVGARVEALLAPWVGRWGRAGAFLAGAAGVYGGSVGLNVVEKSLNSSVHDPERLWQNFWHSTLTTAVLLGTMRVGFRLLQPFKLRLYDGRLGKIFAKRADSGVGTMVGDGIGGVIPTSQPSMFTLTPLGKLIDGLTNASMGIGTMYAGTETNRRYLDELAEQPWDTALFHAVVGYFHAHYAFKLVNRFTDGTLQLGLATIYRDLGEKFKAPELPNSANLLAEMERDIGFLPFRLEETLRDTLKTRVEPEEIKFLPEEIELSLNPPDGYTEAGHRSFTLGYRFNPEQNGYEMIPATEKYLSELAAEVENPRLQAILNILQTKSRFLNRPDVAKMTQQEIEAAQRIADEAKNFDVETILEEATRYLVEAARVRRENPEDRPTVETNVRKAAVALQKAAELPGEVDPRALEFLTKLKEFADREKIELPETRSVYERFQQALEDLFKSSSDSGMRPLELSPPQERADVPFVGQLEIQGASPIDFFHDGGHIKIQDTQGRYVAKAWVFENEGELTPVLMARRGEKIRVEVEAGRWEEQQEQWLYPRGDFRFEIGGKIMAWREPEADVGDLIGKADFANSGLLRVSPRPAPQVKNQEIGFHSWLRVEKTHPEITVAEEVPASLRSQNQPWVILTINEPNNSDPNSISAVAHVSKARRMVLGSEVEQQEMQQEAKAWRVNSGSGLAPEQVLLYLEPNGGVKLVRLAGTDPNYPIWVDGKEIDVEIPVEITNASHILLKGETDRVFELVVQINEQLPGGRSFQKNGAPKPESDSVPSASELAHAETVNRESQTDLQVEGSQEVKVESPEEKPEGGATEVYVGPEDQKTVIYVPPLIHRSYSPTSQTIIGVSMSELTTESIVSSLSRIAEEQASRPTIRYPWVSVDPPRGETPPSQEPPPRLAEENELIPIAVAESSAPKPLAESKPKVEDRFDLPEAPREKTDVMSGFDSGFVSEGEAPKDWIQNLEEDTRVLYGLAKKFLGEDPFAGVVPIYHENYPDVISELRFKDKTMTIPEVNERLRALVQSASPPAPTRSETEAAVEAPAAQSGDYSLVPEPLQVFFTKTGEKFRRAVNQLKSDAARFPIVAGETPLVEEGRVLMIPKDAKENSRVIFGKTQNFLPFLEELNAFAGSRAKQKNLPEEEIQRLEKIIETIRDLSPKFLLGNSRRHHRPRDLFLRSDGDKIQFTLFSSDSSISEYALKPDTLVTLGVRPGQEARMWQGVFEYLISSRRPIDVVVPLRLETGKPNYIGIYFHDTQSNRIDVLRRVWGLVREHGEIFEEKLMFLSHPLKDTEGRVVPAAGEMTYRWDQPQNPLQQLLSVMGQAKAQSQQEGPEGNKVNSTRFRLNLYALLEQAGWIAE